MFMQLVYSKIPSFSKTIIGDFILSSILSLFWYSLSASTWVLVDVFDRLVKIPSATCRTFFKSQLIFRTSLGFAAVIYILNEIRYLHLWAQLTLKLHKPMKKNSDSCLMVLQVLEWIRYTQDRLTGLNYVIITDPSDSLDAARKDRKLHPDVLLLWSKLTVLSP